jgi:hypothetical protein
MSALPDAIRLLLTSKQCSLMLNLVSANNASYRWTHHTALLPEAGSSSPSACSHLSSEGSAWCLSLNSLSLKSMHIANRRPRFRVLFFPHRWLLKYLHYHASRSLFVMVALPKRACQRTPSTKSFSLLVLHPALQDHCSIDFASLLQAHLPQRFSVLFICRLA